MNPHKPYISVRINFFPFVNQLYKKSTVYIDFCQIFHKPSLITSERQKCTDNFETVNIWTRNILHDLDDIRRRKKQGTVDWNMVHICIYSSIYNFTCICFNICAIYVITLLSFKLLSSTAAQTIYGTYLFVTVTL